MKKCQKQQHKNLKKFTITSKMKGLQEELDFREIRVSKPCQDATTHEQCKYSLRKSWNE